MKFESEIVIHLIKWLILKVKQNISLLKHINTKKEYGTVVWEHEFNKPETDEIEYDFNGTIKDCKDKYFQMFE